ncbi:MAG: hypothetical protein AB4911_15745 [Oscillochloridaceae bacterium umkhey_bin13]
MILSVLVETTRPTVELDAAIMAVLGGTPETIFIGEDLSAILFDEQIQCGVERQFFTGDITHMLTVFELGDPLPVQTDIALAQALAQRLDARVYAGISPMDDALVLPSGELQPVIIDQSDDGMIFTVRRIP